MVTNIYLRIDPLKKKSLCIDRYRQKESYVPDAYNSNNH